MLTWLLLAGSLALAITNSPYWLLAAIPLVLWKISQYQFYFGRPWRRLHYPSMREYASAAASTPPHTLRPGEQFNVGPALAALVRSLDGVYEATAARFVDEQLSRGTHLVTLDRDAMIRELRRRNADATPEDTENALQALGRLFSEPDNYRRIRLIIAGYVERRYGPEARAEYLFEVANRNAG